jgi:hypothetical protein
VYSQFSSKELTMDKVEGVYISFHSLCALLITGGIVASIHYKWVNRLKIWIFEAFFDAPDEEIPKVTPRLKKKGKRTPE